MIAPHGDAPQHASLLTSTKLIQAPQGSLECRSKTTCLGAMQ